MAVSTAPCATGGYWLPSPCLRDTASQQRLGPSPQPTGTASGRLRRPRHHVHGVAATPTSAERTHRCGVLRRKGSQGTGSDTGKRRGARVQS
jgi:hypothetical protein